MNFPLAACRALSGNFTGLRPANHPQRRWPWSSYWLASGSVAARLEAWGVADLPEREWLASLHKIFQVERDEFWSWHWTFKSPRLAKPQPLLGVARVTDLAVNVVLPWLWIRAREGGSEKILRQVERLLFCVAYRRRQFAPANSRASVCSARPAPAS